MDKREQVFVSSTFIDLSSEREKVIQGLLEADCFPAGMELFPAADDEKFDLIKGVIDDSDYYLLILGGRYGSEDDETELSYTEMEYDYAVESGKPIIAFVHGEPDKIPVGQTDENDKKAAKLKAFRDKVEKNKVVKRWTNGDQLPGFAAQALMRLRRVSPAVGWVRGDQAMTPEVALKISEMELELERLRTELKTTAKYEFGLIENISSGPDEVSLDLFVDYWAYESEEEYEKEDSEGIHGNGIAGVPTSWDDVLTSLGPYLLQEAEERRLSAVLTDHLSDIFRDRKDLRPGGPYLVLTRATAQDEALHTIIVQFSALGLIEPGRQKRGVQDKGRYWALTPEGNHRLMMLRAVRKELPLDD